MLLEIHPENPNPRYIKMVIECLNDNGTIIYPTDSVYGLGCGIDKQKAVERICQIKGIKIEKSNFSILVDDLSRLSDYCKPVDTPVFKILKRTLPGPFTFILNANNNVPRIFKSNKKTIGLRIPDNKICMSIIEAYGNPIISTSIHDSNEVVDYMTDPYEIHEKFENLVDIVIDGGAGNVFPTTIVDVTNGYPEIIREGLGDINLL